MKMIERIKECFSEMSEGCEAAWDNTISLYIMLKSASRGKQALLGSLIVISSLMMTILFGVAITAAGLIGPLLLWISFAFYSHASPHFCIRMGFVLWYITIQLAIGVSCVAVGSLLF